MCHQQQREVRCTQHFLWNIKVCFLLAFVVPLFSCWWHQNCSRCTGTVHACVLPTYGIYALRVQAVLINTVSCNGDSQACFQSGLDIWYACVNEKVLDSPRAHAVRYCAYGIMRKKVHLPTVFVVYRSKIYYYALLLHCTRTVPTHTVQICALFLP